MQATLSARSSAAQGQRFRPPKSPQQTKADHSGEGERQVHGSGDDKASARSRNQDRAILPTATDRQYQAATSPVAFLRQTTKPPPMLPVRLVGEIFLSNSSFQLSNKGCQNKTTRNVSGTLFRPDLCKHPLALHRPPKSIGTRLHALLRIWQLSRQNKPHDRCRARQKSAPNALD